MSKKKKRKKKNKKKRQAVQQGLPAAAASGAQELIAKAKETISVEAKSLPMFDARKKSAASKGGEAKAKRGFFDSDKNRLLFGGLVVALIVAASLFLYTFRKAIFVPEEVPLQPEQAREAEDVVADSRIRHPLTGEVLEEEIDRPYVFGIMVENAADSWPQSGLEDAFLVIEAPVEAAIPRFIAFYYGDLDTEKIGPVRSARPYYLDWAQEFDALYCHVGGSQEALDLISTRGIFDLNQFYNGQYYWRSNSRYAPHNVYTSIELLKEALEEKIEQERAPEPIYGVWTFKDDAPIEDGKEVPDVSVSFSQSPTYTATWQYDRETNSYIRLQAGSKHKMDDKDLITANNVAIAVMDVEVIDSVGRRKIDTIGEGKGLVLQDGYVIDATWKKDSASERLRFFIEDDRGEIEWNAGKTWIEVTSSSDNIEIDWEDKR